MSSTPLAALPSDEIHQARRQALLTVLISARQGASLTQRELAQRLGRAHSFVAKLEGGQRPLRLLEFCEIGDALHVDARQLFETILTPCSMSSP